MLYNVIIVSTLSIIAAISLYNILYSDIFNCDNIVVVGCDYLISEDNIQNQLSYLKGSSVLKLDNNKIKKLLIENQFVSDASISILLPNTIIIDLDENFTNRFSKVKK